MRARRATLPGHFAIPQLAQPRQVGQAFRLVEKARDAPVPAMEIPLVGVAMLENAAALKVVLAKGAVELRHRKRRHGKLLPEPMPRETEGVLVSVHVIVEEVGILVAPHGQRQGTPASLLVHDELAAFKFRLIAKFHAKSLPRAAVALHPATVRPEKRARLAE